MAKKMMGGPDKPAKKTGGQGPSKGTVGSSKTGARYKTAKPVKGPISPETGMPYESRIARKPLKLEHPATPALNTAYAQKESPRQKTKAKAKYGPFANTYGANKRETKIKRERAYEDFRKIRPIDEPVSVPKKAKLDLFTDTPPSSETLSKYSPSEQKDIINSWKWEKAKRDWEKDKSFAKPYSGMMTNAPKPVVSKPVNYVVQKSPMVRGTKPMLDTSKPRMGKATFTPIKKKLK